MFQLTGLLIVLLLSACVGTADSLHYVVGKTPPNSECEVRILKAGTSEVIRQQTVQGRFNVSFVSGGPFPLKVDVAAYCDGAKVKEIKGLAPRKVEVIDLGKVGS